MNRAIVLGAGKSGRAAQALLAREGWTVTVLDGDDVWPNVAADLCVVSPAIALEHRWLAEARAVGMEIISELELGSRYWRGQSVAVTGSKGKSSLVKLCTDALVMAGRQACTAGNYGTPLCQRVLEYADDGRGVVAVVEVSSFQMEHTVRFHPECAILLNLQTDHLNRHGTMAVYGGLKRRLFQAMGAGDLVLLPLGFDAQGCVPAGAQVHYFDGADLTLDLGQSYFNNPVLRQAAAAAYHLLRKLELSDGQIEAALQGFEPLHHRMEKVADVQGVICIDDSKATSLSATEAALKMVGKPLFLIAGGQLKEKSADFLKEGLAFFAKKVYLIGESSEKLYQSWSTTVPCTQCQTMDVAVQEALDQARSGDVLLLSPGTASFDQYVSYAARGDDFKRCIECYQENKESKNDQ